MNGEIEIMSIEDFAKSIELDMAYKVVITKEVDGALDCIDEYCIEHFHNYEFAKKVFNEIIKVASFFV